MPRFWTRRSLPGWSESSSVAQCGQVNYQHVVLESGSLLPAEDAAGISMRIASASPGPWRAFIELDGGIGGSDVIRVSESDSEADMYLWMGPRLASSALYRFVAGARQDLPALLATARQ